MSAYAGPAVLVLIGTAVALGAQPLARLGSTVYRDLHDMNVPVVVLLWTFRILGGSLIAMGVTFAFVARGA